MSKLLAYELTFHRAESQLSSTTPNTRVSPSDVFRRVVDKRLTDVEKLKALNKDWSPSESFKFPLTMFGKQKRSFQISWQSKYPGLVYSEQEDGAYCKFCVLFDCEAQKWGQLVKEPFRNWRKAVEKFNENFNDHGISTKRGGIGYDLHSFCKLKAQEFFCMMSKQVTVETIIFKGREERWSNNVEILESIVKTLLLCGRQNFALRGHRDDSRHIEEATSNAGNFQALLDYRIDGGDTLLAKHFQTAPRNATYRSKTIQNELITIMGEVIRKKIVTDIKSSGGWFCLSADEVQDVSYKEQLPITIRFADIKGIIFSF